MKNLYPTHTKGKPESGVVEKEAARIRRLIDLAAPIIDDLPEEAQRDIIAALPLLTHPLDLPHPVGDWSPVMIIDIIERAHGPEAGAALKAAIGAKWRGSLEGFSRCGRQGIRKLLLEREYNPDQRPVRK